MISQSQQYPEPQESNLTLALLQRVMQESIVIHCILPNSSRWMDHSHTWTSSLQNKDDFFFHSFTVKRIPGRKRDAEKVIIRTRIDLIKIMQRRHDITKPNKAFIKDTEPSGGFNLKFYIRKMNIPFYPRQC